MFNNNEKAKAQGKTIPEIWQAYINGAFFSTKYIEMFNKKL